MKILVITLSTLVSLSAFASSNVEVKMLGHSSEELFAPLVERFNATVGKTRNINLVYVQDRNAIDKTLKTGDAPAADLMQISDAGKLGHVTKRGLLSVVESATLNQNIPTHLRDPAGHWFGMTKRARIIYYNANMVDPSELSTYEDLADPRWAGKLCLRNSSKMYNTSLVSFFLEIKGVEETRSMIEGWVGNKPKVKSSDMNGVIKSVHDGECLVGVANTYYLGYFSKENPNSPAKVFFPNQDGYGAHVNVKSYGILKGSENKEAALRFLEWFSGPEAQELMTANSNEFPVNPRAKLSPFLKSLGEFKENTTFDMEKATTRKDEALELMQTAGWE